MPESAPDPMLATDREIDQLVHQFEQSLRRGETQTIETLVQRHSDLSPRLERELLLIEIEFRQTAHQPVNWAGYAARFPRFKDLLGELQQTCLPRGDSPAGETSRNDAQDSLATLCPSVPSGPDTVEPALAPLDLSDYALETKLGRGGQGDVYLARQRSLGRRVAVKLLHSSLAHDSQAVNRFVREARMLAQTHHPQIVTIHGLGRSPAGDLFLVMEYIEGNDLAKQIAERQFEIREAVEIVTQIAKAIEHAHLQGVIHRDLKPSNVLWDQNRGPVVTDFGLAKDLRAVDAFTVTEQMMGTPTYMAPEQAHRRFGEVTERVDVYGLSGILYALLTGRPPIAPGPVVEVLQRLTSDQPIEDPRTLRPEIPVSLGRICLHALAKYPDQRCGSIQAFGRDLHQWLASDSTTRDDLPRKTDQVAVPVPVPVQRLEPGGRCGSYHLIATLSTDFTRKVFRATDSSGRDILLKCLPNEWLSDRLKRSQFRQEVLLSCSLNHPCVAKVVEAGAIDGTEFLALEYVEGESVAQVLARDGRLTERLAVELLEPIADALHQIHGAGVIYRDLRPQNIVLTDDGHPMLAEVRFSEELAEHDNVTMSGIGDVTLQYVAPEVLLGRQSNVASDVYTLGATLYALVTAHGPFEDEPNSINALIAKNASRYTTPRAWAPELGDALCTLIADSLKANPAQRPSTAAEFATRLAACLPQPLPDTNFVDSPGLPDGLDHIPDPDNLLHAVWEQLDPELQDAFSLAYNKKRRTGSTRISTRDLFEALSRLGTGPLRQVMNELPEGAMPEPAEPGISLDRAVLREQPLLSDCVRESLLEFRKIEAQPVKVTPVDLFVDVAKHGHGPSVVRLREHGVDPAAIERIVNKLGVRVIKREMLPTPTEAPTAQPESAANKYLVDDNVQFSVYRPKLIAPDKWEPLLVFAHLSELPPDAPAGTPDPIVEVERQVKQLLGPQATSFQAITADSRQPIPHSSHLTLVPCGEGLEFNPPQRTFLWKEPVHREEFRFRAAAHLNGQTVRGRVAVYLGRLLIAEVTLVARVDRTALQVTDQPLSSASHANRYRRIYACVAEEDRGMVAELEHCARLLRDTVICHPLPSHPSAELVARQTRLIESADVFQLYWSRKALAAPQMEQEWRHALSLSRPDFIRSLYWEEPFPTCPERLLPPPELMALGFQKIPARDETVNQSPVPDSLPDLLLSSPLQTPAESAAPIHRKLKRIRAPRVVLEGPTSASLKILSGPAQGQIAVFDMDRVTIGRHASADLTLESHVISRYHAQLVRDQNEWFIEDLNTSSGTQVNGRQIAGRQRLEHGDRIHLGNVLISFHSTQEPPDLPMSLPALTPASEEAPDDPYSLSLPTPHMESWRQNPSSDSSRNRKRIQRTSWTALTLVAGAVLAIALWWIFQPR